MSRAAVALALLGALVASVGCWTDEPPDFGPNTGCNQNGTCDDLESCEVCPADCPCCTAIRVAAAQQVQNETRALGKADGKVAELGPNAILELEVGGRIQDSGTVAGGDRADFELVGQVRSASGSGTGYFIVSVVDLDVQPRQWKIVGSWTKDGSARAAFDLDLADLSRSETRFLRIQGVQGSQGVLDAVSVKHCVK